MKSNHGDYTSEYCKPERPADGKRYNGEPRGNGKANGIDHAETVIPTSAHSMEALKTMTFEPIKYVVPGVIIEGLTILASG